LLLGRPFLATGRALIDVERGDLMLRTDGEQIIFNVFEAMKRLEEEEGTTMLLCGCHRG
ncbi:hypothetical protein A2U01_0116570, partial [Trifolium medium]|nr:hypothetical protein [Trifolium medium]